MRTSATDIPSESDHLRRIAEAALVLSIRRSIFDIVDQWSENELRACSTALVSASLIYKDLWRSRTSRCGGVRSLTLLDSGKSHFPRLFR